MSVITQASSVPYTSTVSQTSLILAPIIFKFEIIIIYKLLNTIQDILLVGCSVQKNLLVKNLSEVNNIRGEVLKYEQKLNRERLKCRALEEMLLKPTNIHRWRLLKVKRKLYLNLLHDFIS